MVREKIVDSHPKNADARDLWSILDEPSPPVPDKIQGRINGLPAAIARLGILPYLNRLDRSALSLVSKNTKNLFQPNPLQKMANKVLLQVMRGEQAKAEFILKRRPDLLLVKGTATDYSNRKFHCTAFEYALWALDTRYMCQMMANCIPCDQDGEHIKQKLLLQLRMQEHNGITYCFDDVIVKEKHYDFGPLITALQTYVTNYDVWNAAHDSAAIEKQWHKVGLAQRDVPAHVAQHYCDPDESFNPTPTFTKQTFVRSLEFSNNLSDHPEKNFWFPSPFRLGSDLAILSAKGPGEYQGGSVNAQARLGSGGGVEMRRMDLEALTALCKVRTKDIQLLIKKLQDPIRRAEPSCVIS